MWKESKIQKDLVHRLNHRRPSKRLKGMVEDDLYWDDILNRCTVQAAIGLQQRIIGKPYELI